MKLLIYILGIIGSTGSLIYSFNFNTSPHLIFVFCIMAVRPVPLDNSKKESARYAGLQWGNGLSIYQLV